MAAANVPALVQQTAAQYGVDGQLALSVAAAESGFNQNAVSPVGAIGVMQLMPATAASIGVNPYDLADNIKGGILYLRDQLSRFGDVALALAAYNWGPGKVATALARYGAAWLAFAPAETQRYVASIAGITAAAPPASSDQASPGSVSTDVYMPPDAQEPSASLGWLALALLGAAAAYFYFDVDLDFF
jgi:soluble lytic murein transglycosylase-like protein